MDEDDKKIEPEQSIDIDSIILSRNIIEAHQEGNYLVLKTDNNITFRQRIPQDKILNKANGKFVLQNIAIQ